MKIRKLLTIGLLLWGGISFGQGINKELKPLNKTNFQTPNPAKKNGADDFTSKAMKVRLDSVMIFSHYDGEVDQNGIKYKYDADNKVIENIISFTDGNQWFDGLKEVYSYNSANSRSERVKYYIDEDNYLAWNSNPEDKTVYEYDPNGNLTIEYEFYWDSTLNQLKPTWKYEYSNIGLSSVVISSFYEAGVYVLRNKDEISYNSDMKEIKNIRSWWQNGGWKASTKAETTYDAKGNVKDYIQYFYDDNTQTWGDIYWGSKSTNTYNASGEITERVMSRLNTSTSQWENEEKHVFVYDNVYTFSSIILPNYYEDYENVVAPFLFHHKLDQMKTYLWNVATSNWSSTFTTNQYHYSTQTLNTQTLLENASVSFYPNPAQTQLTISAKDDQLVSLQITDLNGKLLSKQFVSGKSTEINVETLDGGIYLITIETEKGSVVNRFVKN